MNTRSSANSNNTLKPDYGSCTYCDTQRDEHGDCPLCDAEKVFKPDTSVESEPVDEPCIVCQGTGRVQVVKINMEGETRTYTIEQVLNKIEAANLDIGYHSIADDGYSDEFDGKNTEEVIKLIKPYMEK